jgi:hypothetical protein
LIFNASEVQGFEIKRREVGEDEFKHVISDGHANTHLVGGPTALKKTQTRFLDTSIEAGKSYEYKIRAFATSAEFSDRSNVERRTVYERSEVFLSVPAEEQLWASAMCFNPTPQSNYSAWLARNFNSDSSPTVIKEDGKIKVWSCGTNNSDPENTCSSDDDCNPGEACDIWTKRCSNNRYDHIFYTEFNAETGLIEKEPELVLAPQIALSSDSWLSRSDSADGHMACAPSVIKYDNEEIIHSLWPEHPENKEPYLMYYECGPRVFKNRLTESIISGGTNMLNQICLAVSRNGTKWYRYHEQYWLEEGRFVDTEIAYPKTDAECERFQLDVGCRNKGCSWDTGECVALDYKPTKLTPVVVLDDKIKEQCDYQLDSYDRINLHLPSRPGTKAVIDECIRIREEEPETLTAPSACYSCAWTWRWDKDKEFPDNRASVITQRNIANYGAGHPSAVVKDGKVWLFYLNSKGVWAEKGVRLRKGDGIIFAAEEGGEHTPKNPIDVAYYEAPEGVGSDAFLGSLVLGGRNLFAYSRDGLDWNFMQWNKEHEYDFGTDMGWGSADRCTIGSPAAFVSDRYGKLDTLDKVRLMTTEGFLTDPTYDNLGVHPRCIAPEAFASAPRGASYGLYMIEGQIKDIGE